MVKNLKPANTQNNVRQLGSTSTSASHQGQILSALDVLGAKLVRSESERDTMRRLLNESLEAQDRLETNIERTQIHIERRIDQIEENATADLSDEDKAFIAEQKKRAGETQEFLDDQLDRQLKVEDKLRDAQQTIQKLQRKLDSQEQKRARLQRRIERVENIAADAQNALEAKALVLLTDQTKQIRQLTALQNQHNNYIETLQNNVLEAQATLPVQTSNQWGESIKQVLSGSGSLLAVLVALGLGWNMATSFYTPPQTQLPSSPSMVQEEAASIEGDIASFMSDWAVSDTLNQSLHDMDGGQSTDAFDVLQTVMGQDIAMDRDLSLPQDIQDLEDKAFAGIAEAQHDLAALYTAGQAGVTQNYERASFWFQKAAQQGIGNAAYNLGVLYQQGLGQEQDLQRALDWYRRAAQLGHPEAQYNLGIAYIEGVGTRYNPNMAAAFFQQAAFKGIVEAAYNLGLILENGLLGEVRPNDALKWYRGAAENGSADARQAFTTLATTLDMPLDKAGLLDNGESLASFINPYHSDTETLFHNAKEDISLGTLVPTENQILIAQIQEQLRKARLYNGPQDGIVGAGTVKAIKSYQRQQNLAMDGKATPSLLTFMLQQGTYE